MAQVINTNIASLNSQRHLNNTQSTMRTAMERLSSGLRINSAKDDAAGLAISNRMTTQINGMNQAARNANDGISLAQTGEGALQQITNNLQRMRELAVQSRNATNTSDDRESLNAEFQQLLNENDRLAQTTSFNGRNILDGSFGSDEFQVGANVGERISVDVSSSMRTNAIGNVATADYKLKNTTGSESTNQLLDNSGDITINGTDIGAATDAGNGLSQSSAAQIAAAINAKTDTHGVTATAMETTKTISATDIGNANFTDSGTNDTGSLQYTLTINGTQVFQDNDSDPTRSADDLASAINAVKEDTGVSATVDSQGNLTLSAADGRNIEVKENFNGGSDSGDTVKTYFGNTLSGTSSVDSIATYKGEIQLSATRDITVGEAASQDMFSAISAGGSDTTKASTLDSANVLTANGSDTAMRKIDEALKDVDNLRGTFGAIQSRFESTVASLQTSTENLSAARSRIQDADFAAETAKLAKSQVLQQAGTSMLAQANKQPQSVLALLQ